MRWPFLFFVFFNKADHTEAPPDPPVPPPGRRFQFQNPLHVNPPPLDFKQSMTRQKKWFWTAFIFRFSARLTETVALAANFRLTLSAGREKALYSEKKKQKKPPQQPEFDSLERLWSSLLFQLRLDEERRLRRLKKSSYLCIIFFLLICTIGLQSDFYCLLFKIKHPLVFYISSRSRSNIVI